MNFFATQQVKDALNQKATEAGQLLTSVTTHLQENYAEPAVNRVATGLTSVVQMVETYDASATQRQVVYGNGPTADQQGKVPSPSKDQTEEDKQPSEHNQKIVEAQNEEENKISGILKLKIVAGDLIDIWLHEGQKGINFVKAQQAQACQFAEQNLNYATLFEKVKTSSHTVVSSIKATVSESVEAVQQRVVFFYDEASNFVGMLLRVIHERQTELAEYVCSTYQNVSVFMHDNWMRLDFNQDGSVDAEDLRKNLTELYNFLLNYHFIEETLRISSSLYDEAKKKIKKDAASAKLDSSEKEDEPEPEQKEDKEADVQVQDQQEQQEENADAKPKME